MPNIGPLEIAIVLVIVLLIFGPKRLPGLGKQLGTGMREFKESITGKDKDDDDDDARRARPTIVADVEAALGRPEGEQAPLEGDAVARAHAALARSTRLSHRWHPRSEPSRTMTG